MSDRSGEKIVGPFDGSNVGSDLLSAVGLAKADGPTSCTRSAQAPTQHPNQPASAHPWAAALVGGIFAVCLIRLAGFVHDNAVDVLYNDQWDALWPLLEGQGPWAAFLQQHGPPRMGLGGVLNWFLYGATGWDVRAEAWAGVVVLVLATGVALVLSVRLRGRLAWTDAAFPLLLLSPLHWETLTFTIFVGAKILPLLLVLLVAWAWSAESSAVRTVGVGLGGTLALFTGYGIVSAPATIGLALLLWLRTGTTGAPGGRGPATVILLVMGAAMAWFASGYQWSPGTAGWRFPVPNWWDYPRFCALMFTNLLGWRAITVGSVAAGGLLLALVLVAFFTATLTLWRGQATGRTRAAWFLTGTTLGYAALAAVGRLPTSIEAAFLWRYVSLLMPALCGLALLAEEWAGARGPRWRLGFGVAWLALAGVVWGNFTPETYAATLAKAKRLWVASYLETRDLDAANQAADFGIYPDPASPQLAEKLRHLDQRHLSFFRDVPEKK